LAEKGLIKPCGEQGASLRIYTTAVEKAKKDENVKEPT